MQRPHQQHSIPKRGRIHVDYGIYLGGEELGDGWNLLNGNNFQYETRCHNIKSFGAINKTLTLVGALLQWRSSLLADRM